MLRRVRWHLYQSRPLCVARTFGPCDLRRYTARRATPHVRARQQVAPDRRGLLARCRAQAPSLEARGPSTRGASGIGSRQQSAISRVVDAYSSISVNCVIPYRTSQCDKDGCANTEHYGSVHTPISPTTPPSTKSEIIAAIEAGLITDTRDPDAATQAAQFALLRDLRELVDVLELPGVPAALHSLKYSLAATLVSPDDPSSNRGIAFARHNFKSRDLARTVA